MLWGFGYHCQHLPVKGFFEVGRLDELLQLGGPFRALEESFAVGEVRSKGLVCQSQFVEEERCPVSPEDAAVKADVEKPILFEGWFGGGCVKQELGVRFGDFQTCLEFEESDLIDTKGGDIGKG